MAYYAIQRNGLASREEMRTFVSIEDRGDSVVCPKPRRFGPLNTAFNESTRPLRWYLGHQTDLSDDTAGSELLDIILSKGGCPGDERPGSHVASSSPFLRGSPPSRVANPLVQDVRFREDKQVIPPYSPIPPTAGSKSSPNSSSARNVGCVRANFGNNPVVRIEGFNCLDRDRRNCSIPTLA